MVNVTKKKDNLFTLISQKGNENIGNNHCNLRSQGHGKSKTNHLIMTHWWQTWQKNNNLFTLISQKGDEDTGNNHWRWNFLIFKQLSLLSYLPYEQQKLPFGAFDPMNGYFFDVVNRCNHQMTQYKRLKKQWTTPTQQHKKKPTAVSTILRNTQWMRIQRAKKVVSDSPGLVDFAIGLLNSVFNLSDGQVIFF